uniref:hypothetical protein n=1 Tax=Streptomyces sp. CA-141956 TaxID=3240051 RepID=UPI003F497E41
MPSFRLVVIPQCGSCAAAVRDEHGRELLLAERFLPAEVRQRLESDGWSVAAGDRRLNNGPHEMIGEDRLRCPGCVARSQAAAAAAQARHDAALAQPRVKTVDVSARLGAGWTLTQRAGDADQHYWLVEHEGTVHGSVNRYQRKDGTFSSGWEAHFFSGGHEWRLDAISSCQKLHKSSFLWSSRDLAAWGVAHRPKYGAARPAWATRTAASIR